MKPVKAWTVAEHARVLWGQPPGLGAKVWDELGSILDIESQMIEDALKDCLIAGWATSEIVLCSHPRYRRTIRVGTDVRSHGYDVFETVTKWPETFAEKMVITVEGRWLGLPYKQLLISAFGV